LQQTVVDNVSKLAKLSIPKTNKIIKQFYGSKEKITIIHKLDSLPSLQYEFIRQLICPSKGGNLEEITQDKNDLEELNNENDEENDNIQNELCDLFLLQIDLLIVLKKKDEVLPSIKEQIKAYPKIYPKQKCLEKCLEYKINDAAVYLYQSTGKNDEALALTKNNTELCIWIQQKKKRSSASLVRVLPIPVALRARLLCFHSVSAI
jgi:phosphomevalonate kinase